MYPNIYDLYCSPAFRVTSRSKDVVCTNWTNFWRIVNGKNKYECEVCHNPIFIRRTRKYLVCQKCIHKYILDVAAGKREPKPFVKAVAA
jgi:ribosomal protein L37AE/L43A